MFLDGLNELGADEFGAGGEEVSLIAAHVEPFHGGLRQPRGAEHRLELLQGEVASGEGGDAGEAERVEERIAAGRGPEAAREAVIHVEGEEPVGQSGVGDAVDGKAPLSEKDEMGAEGSGEGFAAGLEPGPEGLELGWGAGTQEGAAILGEQFTRGSDGEPEVGSIDLLLDEHLGGEQFADLGGESTLS